jgi:hypothetical protein
MAPIPRSLPPGYFLAQEAWTLPRNVPWRRNDPYFAPFLTRASAKRYFEQIAGKVDGVDFVNGWYEPSDADEARAIAEIGRSCGVDLWAGLRWYKQFRDLPVVPAEFIAWGLEENGRLAPVMWEERNHRLDYMNPAAVDWILDAMDQRYWPHMKGIVNGWFFPEAAPIRSWQHVSREGLKPTTLMVYSPYVLEQWRNYCETHAVRQDGQLINRFPVNTRQLAEAEPDKVMFVPDDRPAAVPFYTRFLAIPRGTPVWLAWEDFLCGLFHSAFVHRIAARLNRANAGNPDWRGACYFQNDASLLDYRDFQGGLARTGHHGGWWPQGRRVGVDIHRILADPEITCVIAEVNQPVCDYCHCEENSLSNIAQLAGEAGRAADWGFMLHSTDWLGGIGRDVPGGGILDDIQEGLRWEMFAKYRPRCFSFYSVHLALVPGGAWFNERDAAAFWRRVADYKQSWKV